MRIFKRLFGPWRNQKSANNTGISVGEWRGTIQDGKYTCWEAVGPVREDWNILRPEIKDFIENSCKPGAGLSLGIYMIGTSQDTAAPKILICSPDKVARKYIRQKIAGIGMLNDHPHIGLGDASKLPDLLAIENIHSEVPVASADGRSQVLSVAPDIPFGRRLFISRQNNESFRPATAGPILHVAGKVYQITAGHAFETFCREDLWESTSSMLDDCDFDGQSDSEDYQPQMVSEAHSNGDPSLTEPLVNLGICVDTKGLQPSGPSSSTTSESQGSAFSKEHSMQESISADDGIPQSKSHMSPQTLDRIGTVAFSSDVGNKHSLDYGLLELEGHYKNSTNQVPYGPNGSQRWLTVRMAEKVSVDVNIVTRTSSSGFLKGKLHATASYIRLPNRRNLQEVFPVYLDGLLKNGDCGSGVIDQLSGNWYGHIVAGNVDSGFAYIVPATEVLIDIEEILGSIVRLDPFAPLSAMTMTLPSHAAPPPLNFVEFASKQYFGELEQTDRPHGQYPDDKLAPIHRFSPSLEILNVNRDGQSRTDNLAKSTVCVRAEQRSSLMRKSIARIRHLHLKDPPPRNDESFLEECTRKALQDTCLGFKKSPLFELPNPIQVQIVALLDVPDILNFRGASRACHSLISSNEAPISRSFLQYHPFPKFASLLYPHPSPIEINLSYICGLWHRMCVTSDLAFSMTEWIAHDIFLRKTRKERLDFSMQQMRIERRLTPLLFTCFHFLETYRQLQLQRRFNRHRSSDTRGIDPIELEIMRLYDDQNLLQVHQIFELLTSFLDRRLRQPSWRGPLESSLRGNTKPVPEQMLVAILRIGGLREIKRIVRIDGHDTRRAAADVWYESLPHEDGSAVPRSSNWLFGHRRRRRETQATFHANTSSVHRESISNNSSRPLASSLGEHPPMGPLPLQNLGFLLSSLPELKNIWLPTAEAVLLGRKVVERRQDIKRNEQVMRALVHDGITEADKLFYGW